jgi:hypothetical protein
MGYPMDFKLETDGTEVVVSATCQSREEVDCVIQALENAKAILPAPPRPEPTVKAMPYPRTKNRDEDEAVDAAFFGKKR